MASGGVRAAAPRRRIGHADFGPEPPVAGIFPGQPRQHPERRRQDRRQHGQVAHDTRPTGGGGAGRVPAGCASITTNACAQG